MASGSTTPAQGFPQISLPFVKPDGSITQTWLQLLISLWNRTGAGSGSNPAAPSGLLAEFAGTAAPAGWLVCDGSAVSRTTYANLFGVIGTTWGAGDGSATFNLPNLQGKFLLGAGGSYAVGHTGGSSSQTLSVDNLPAHNHGVTDPGHTHTVNDPGHTHSITDPGHRHTSETGASSVTSGSAAGGAAAGNTGTSTTGITISTATTGVTNNMAETGITTQDTGAGTPVDILPPYGVVLVIVKT